MPDLTKCFSFSHIANISRVSPLWCDGNFYPVHFFLLLLQMYMLFFYNSSSVNINNNIKCKILTHYLLDCICADSRIPLWVNAPPLFTPQLCFSHTGFLSWQLLLRFCTSSIILYSPFPKALLILLSHFIEVSPLTSPDKKEFIHTHMRMHTYTHKHMYTHVHTLTHKFLYSILFSFCSDHLRAFEIILCFYWLSIIIFLLYLAFFPVRALKAPWNHIMLLLYLPLELDSRKHKDFLLFSLRLFQMPWTIACV